MVGLQIICRVIPLYRFNKINKTNKSYEFFFICELFNFSYFIPIIYILPRFEALTFKLELQVLNLRVTELSLLSHKFHISVKDVDT